jgi:hypothetical protein
MTKVVNYGVFVPTRARPVGVDLTEHHTVPAVVPERRTRA